MNLIYYFLNFQININDVTKAFFCGEFPPFCKHKKGHQHQQNIFLIKKNLSMKKNYIFNSKKMI